MEFIDHNQSGKAVEVGEPVLFDFATLVHCNHSILSYGTFGFWTAYMKKSGNHVYFHMCDFFSIFRHLSTQLKQYIEIPDPCVYLENEKWQKNISCDS